MATSSGLEIGADSEDLEGSLDGPAFGSPGIVKESARGMCNIEGRSCSRKSGRAGRSFHRLLSRISSGILSSTDWSIFDSAGIGTSSATLGSSVVVTAAVSTCIASSAGSVGSAFDFFPVDIEIMSPTRSMACPLRFRTRAGSSSSFFSTLAGI